MHPYTREELQRVPTNGQPSRGEYCDSCQSWIPSYADLTPELDAEVRSTGSSIQQIKRMRDITGCPLGWAKLWLHHPHGPVPHKSDSGPPCPECGQNIKTELAKQCLHCGADWH